MHITRRSLVRGSAATLVGAMLARPLAGMQTAQLVDEFPTSNDPRMRNLIETAVDAATTAGATYADARLTYEIGRNTLSPQSFSAVLGFGVRALVNGYWGFASSPVWNSIEAARLGRAAVAHANANMLGAPRKMSLAPLPNPESGEWTMSVKDDPFEMDFDEILDFRDGLVSYIMQKPRMDEPRIGFEFFRQQKAFGSSLGQFTTQRLYRTGAVVGLLLRQSNPVVQGSLSQLGFAGMGFEFIRDQPLRQWVDAEYAEMLEIEKLPVVPVDVGKYPILFSGDTFAKCVESGIGLATEIDRAMGFRANGSGTSYLIDPEAMLGTFQLGTPALHITASRSIPGSVGTVRWDDEGVVPHDFVLVRNGILNDMQTDREGVAFLKPLYDRTQRPIRSNACAYCADAIDEPRVSSASLIVQPDATTNATLDTLRNDIAHGVELKNGGALFDYQLITGFARAGYTFEIRQGKRIARMAGASVMFRTPELLKNIQYMGSPHSVQSYGISRNRSVSTPPVLVKDMTLIDWARKA